MRLNTQIENSKQSLNIDFINNNNVLNLELITNGTRKFPKRRKIQGLILYIVTYRLVQGL